MNGEGTNIQTIALGKWFSVIPDQPSGYYCSVHTGQDSNGGAESMWAEESLGSNLSSPVSRCLDSLGFNILSLEMGILTAALCASYS